MGKKNLFEICLVVERDEQLKKYKKIYNNLIKCLMSKKIFKSSYRYISSNVFQYDFMRVELEFSYKYCDIKCTREITEAETDRLNELRRLEKEYWYRATYSCGKLSNYYWEKYYEYKYDADNIRDGLTITSSISLGKLSPSLLLDQLKRVWAEFLCRYDVE